MHTLRIAVGIAWGAFWLGWLLAAFTAKGSVGGGWGRLGPRGIAAIAVVVMVRVVHGGSLEVHSLTLGVIGTLVSRSGSRWRSGRA